jgi:hypothetical protein
MSTITENTIGVELIDPEGYTLCVTGCKWHIHLVKIWMEKWNAQYDPPEAITITRKLEPLAGVDASKNAIFDFLGR